MNRDYLDTEDLQGILNDAVIKARLNQEGALANYIPELERVDPNKTSLAVKFTSGDILTAGDAKDHYFTLQSVAKMIVLAGLLEEEGAEKVISWTGMEPTGRAFASISQLEKFGPVPANPFVNSGAIALCNRIPGAQVEDKLQWLNHWTEKLFDTPLPVNQEVFESEYRTGDRNRAIAYLLKSNGVLRGDVDETLRVYFTLCSYQANVIEAAHLPMLLANGGRDAKGQQVLSSATCKYIIAVMATCGLYDSSGSHLVQTGMPAKSGVSGLMVAVALGHAGIATSSPRLDSKGTSIRGGIMLRSLSNALNWHFAS